MNENKITIMNRKISQNPKNFDDCQNDDSQWDIAMLFQKAS